MAVDTLIEESIRFLDSDEARRQISVDMYWPKWDAPWWHMALLHEMGLSHRIPKTTLDHMASRLKAQLVPFFFHAEVPEGRDPRFDAPCPCQLGNIYQIMSAAGTDMDEVLPWARSWFMRYQMPDGGLSCDEDAYKSTPPASSIVGTIAPLEAILFYTNRSFTQEEERFLDQGAKCLIDRKLSLGCSAEYNAEERSDEQDWLKPCFPRFYLYDVLRGLNFILQWAEKRQKTLPMNCVSGVIDHLNSRFPNDEILIERHSFEGKNTRIQSPSGEWKQDEARFHSLLREISKIGLTSPRLSAQWRESQARFDKLRSTGLIQ